MNMQMQRQGGFTLFELLVATSVFAIASYMAYTGLMQVMNAREHTGRVEARLADIQMTFLHLERDLQHVVERSIRDGYGTPQGEIRGDELAAYRLELTRTGRPVPEGIPRSRLQRVGYLLEDEKLYRVTWPVLDFSQDTQPTRTSLIDGVDEVEIRFLTAGNKWVNKWDAFETPVDAQAQQQTGGRYGIPRAVAIKITLQDYGEINRMFLLHES